MRQARRVGHSAERGRGAFCFTLLLALELDQVGRALQRRTRLELDIFGLLDRLRGGERAQEVSVWGGGEGWTRGGEGAGGRKWRCGVAGRGGRAGGGETPPSEEVSMRHRSRTPPPHARPAPFNTCSSSLSLHSLETPSEYLWSTKHLSCARPGGASLQ